MNWLSRILYGDRRLGLRIIKTGVAVTVCVAISRLISIDQPFVAVITAVMSMGKSIDSTVKSGKNKLIGVLIGSLTGGVFAMLSPSNAGLCGIGAILVLYLCHILRLENAGALACVIFAAIMFESGAAFPAWLYALSCAQGALIGIAVAVIVNLTIMPPNYSGQIKKIDRELRSKMTSALAEAKERHPIDIREIESGVEQLSRNIRLYVSESKLFRWNDDAVFDISYKITVYRMLLDELKVLEIMDLNPDEEPQGDMLAVYRYHVGRLAELYEAVQEQKKPKEEPADKK